MHPPYRGVAFLLSLGTLPIACGEDKDPSATTDTSNGPSPLTDVAGSSTTSVDPATASPTTSDPSGTTTSPGTTSTGTSTSTSEPPDPSTGPHATTFLTNNTTSEGTDDTGPPDFPPIEHQVCQEYADHIVECLPRYRDYAGYFGYYCDSYINYGNRLDGPGCAAAIEALIACFNAIPCADLEDEGNCAAEQTAVDVACPSFEQVDTDTDTDTFGTDTDTESSSTG